ncbi:hypothetical protein EDC01DRAFT_651951 [Geopyxis carbonaria]|nr:hypothetical protein EDC01DRAFT_651951 [Geopyxis carbonaria]
MIGEDEGHVQEIDNILRKRTQIMARLSFELSAVTRVVNYQISTLEKFVKVSKFAESNNMIGRQRITHDLVTILLPGKEKVQRELLNLIPTIKYLQKLVSQTMADRIAQRQTWAATKQAEETKIQVELSKRAQELSRQTQEQGKSVLVFTIITTIFLPMSFFTSYFGMNTPDIRETTTKQSGFWVICGPISAFVIIMALLVAFPSKIMKLLGINKKQSPGDMEEQRIIKED